MAKAAGGRWNARRNVGKLAYKRVTVLNLPDRIGEQAYTRGVIVRKIMVIFRYI